ncbi:hypothetical protein MBLNU457_6881t1 [Dothideomycetes sp. NU457]
MASPQFDSISSAITAFKSGAFIIVLDSEGRENEGDLIIAASALTPSKASFMIHHSSGYLCAPMRAARADALDLQPMVSKADNSDPNRTAYTVTVDAAQGVTTGISATDRSVTCRALADVGVGKSGFRRPGHVVPLRAVEGGVRARQGHTEAAIEFCRLAWPEREPVGVIAELVEESEDVSRDGALIAERTGTEMMKRDGCLAFGRRYGIKVVTIEDLVKYVEEEERR